MREKQDLYKIGIVQGVLSKSYKRFPNLWLHCHKAESGCLTDLFAVPIPRIIGDNELDIYLYMKIFLDRS